MTLAEAMRASLLISALVGEHGGRWAPEVLDQYYRHQEWRGYVPRSYVESLADLLTKSVGELRAVARKEEEGLGRFDPELRKLPFNPLHLNPLVRLDDGEVWAPEHWLLWRTFLQENLYARARNAFGDHGTRLLGQRVQAYAGQLLESASGLVIPEFTYGKGGGRDTIDWFWVTDDAVFLVECKSFSLHLSARAGGGTFDEQVQRTIVKARSQIDRTAQAMRDGRISRPEVPTNLPVYGLIVTSDPVPLANTGAPEFGPRGTTQTLVASLRSLERLCGLEAEDPAQVLLKIFQDDERRTWDLEQSLPKPDQAKYRNPPPINAALTSLRPRPIATAETTS